MDQRDKLTLLKDILLTDEREYAEAVRDRIEALEEILHERQKLAPKVDPIIEAQLQAFVKEMPKTLGPTITKTLQAEIKNSKDQVVEALYPIIGKMIKKYVAQEIKLLSERIGKEVEDSFTAKGWKRRFKSWFTGVSEEDLIISELTEHPEVLQVMIIEKDSGIMVGSFSRSETIDEDMVSGMLTAIKSFVEDAFHQQSQNLELIEYELFNIHIQSFVKHYIAVVINGQYSTHFKDKLQDVIFEFYENFIQLMEYSDEIDQRSIAKELTYYFTNENL